MAGMGFSPPRRLWVRSHNSLFPRSCFPTVQGPHFHLKRLNQMLRLAPSGRRRPCWEHVLLNSGTFTLCTMKVHYLLVVFIGCNLQRPLQILVVWFRKRQSLFNLFSSRFIKLQSGFCPQSPQSHPDLVSGWAHAKPHFGSALTTPIMDVLLLSCRR